MYIDILSVDKLMKSTIESKSYLNTFRNKQHSESFYILEKAAKEMLEQVRRRKESSADILKKAANEMLKQVINRKQNSTYLQF